ncbi:hypothetical protein [Vibrio cholerae]|uniref:hypothetical protein n=1 Tax=Vibrio cholerae TaxID=666 RepID=UPI00156161C6|nr:hypothetical protein [Vibrio cholerae]NOF88419.1 hypothetical protein [Vibrio cholerae]NOF95276.1 hypothetical protein [Vibrio cholerae]
MRTGVTTRQRWSEAENLFLAKHAQDMSSDEIAEKLGRTKQAVNSKAENLGISMRKHGEKHHLAKVSNHDVELCRQLHDEGVKPCEIAEKMELGYTYVQWILNYRIRRNG